MDFLQRMNSMRRSANMSRRDTVPGDSNPRLQISSFGRPVALGVLYDEKTDQYDTNTRLWSQDSMTSMTTSRNCFKEPTIRIEKASSFAERASLLGLSLSLRLSFLSESMGVIKGSWQFITDAKTSLNSVSITLVFIRLSKFDELIVGSSVDHPNRLKRIPSTHVVTGIQFGAKALFTFELEVKEKEDPAEAMRALEMAVSELVTTFQRSKNEPPSYSAANVEANLFNAIKCRYFGDFKIDPSPQTLSDVFRSAEVIKTSDAEVPLEVFLTPLSQVGGKTSSPTLKLTEEQINEVGEYYQGLNDVISSAKARIDQLSGTPWHSPRETLSEFLKYVLTVKAKYQEAVLKVLPEARENSKGCGQKLSKILTTYRDNSPFSAQLLQNWLKYRERECTILVSFSNALQAEGAKMFNDSAECQRMVPQDKGRFPEKTENLFLSCCEDKLQLKSENTIIMLVTFPVSSYPDNLKLFLKDAKKFQRATYETSDTWIGSTEYLQASEIVTELIQILRRSGSLKFPPVCVALASGSSDQRDGPLQVTKLCKKDQQWFPWKSPSPPDEVSCANVTDKQVELSWLPVSCEFTSSVQYKVEIFRVDAADSQPFWSDITDWPSAIAINLCPNAEFEARVRAVTPLGDSQQSAGLRFRTQPLVLLPCSEFVKKHWCEPVPLVKQKGEDFPGDIYKLKKRKIELQEPCTCPKDVCVCPVSFEVGDSKQAIKPPKFLLIVGETGTGKSTFVNGIANAFYRVKYKDNFRLKLIVEQEGKTPTSAESFNANQAYSQTSFVTVYTLFPVYTGGSDKSEMECPLTIIDTPGFGDTRGEAEDKLIVKKISKVLGEDGFSFPGMTGLLHAIAFVVRASQYRLTYPQRYIFDQSLALFGNDVEHIILPVFTFADSRDPQALAALKEHNVPLEKFLKFNNGMLFADNTPIDHPKYQVDLPKNEMLQLKIKLSETALHWDQGELSYTELFNIIKENDGISLKKTREVLKNRKTLENCAESLLCQVKSGTSMLTSLEENLNLIETLDVVIKDADMKKTRKVKVPRVRKKAVQNGRFVTICMTCSKTCHHACVYQDDNDKIKCSAMDPTGHCTVCPKNCFWNQHCNRDYFFEDFEEEEVVTVKEIADKYHVNMKDRDAKRQLLEHLLQDFKETSNNLSYNLVTIYKCLQDLDKMALRQYPLSIVQYVENLIIGQETEQKPGWEGRVKYLRDALESAKIIAAAREGQDPLGERREKVMERCKNALESEFQKKSSRFDALYQLLGWK